MLPTGIGKAEEGGGAPPEAGAGARRTRIPSSVPRVRGGAPRAHTRLPHTAPHTPAPPSHARSRTSVPRVRVASRVMVSDHPVPREGPFLLRSVSGHLPAVLSPTATGLASPGRPSHLSDVLPFLSHLRGVMEAGSQNAVSDGHSNILAAFTEMPSIGTAQKTLPQWVRGGALARPPPGARERGRRPVPSLAMRVLIPHDPRSLFSTPLDGTRVTRRPCRKNALLHFGSDVRRCRGV